MEPLLGEIKLFGGNFAPRGWMLCQGQILSIATNTALFSLLGTTYGGNGQTTFALPDLRGRYPMQQGQGPGLTPRDLGEIGGSETVSLIATEMPAHTHILNASTAIGDQNLPTGNLMANTGGLDKEYVASPVDTTMNPACIGVAGGSQPHQNMSPFLALNFIIAIQGAFPSRN